jgi:hypothetical protein
MRPAPQAHVQAVQNTRSYAQAPERRARSSSFLVITARETVLPGYALHEHRSRDNRDVAKGISASRSVSPETIKSAWPFAGELEKCRPLPRIERSEKRRHLYLRPMKPVSEAPSSIAFGRFRGSPITNLPEAVAFARSAGTARRCRRRIAPASGAE